MKVARFNMTAMKYLSESCRSTRNVLSVRQWHRSVLMSKRYASTSTSSQPEAYDVVCVGGGPAGLSLLTGLRSSPVTSHLKVALIEGQEIRIDNDLLASNFPYSNRCSSLTPSSVAHLKKIEAWNMIDDRRVQAYQEMQVWDGVSGSKINFDWSGSTQNGGNSTMQTSTIAYMIENRNLTQGLLRRLEALGGVTMFSGTRVDKISHGDDLTNFDMQSWPIVSLSSGQKIAARLLIGADGANSPVRQFVGIPSRGWDYNRHGVVATLHMSDPGWGGDEHKIAYQRFLPSGPIAMLPLPGPFATLVWSTTPERAALLKRLSSDDFVALVNAGFRLSPLELKYLHEQDHGHVDEVAWREKHSSVQEELVPKRVVGVEPGTIANFPLKMRHADTYVGERVALIGDAAHTIHPLAGQGLNQGQGDASALIRAIETAMSCGADIGSQQTLESFNSDRYAANNLMIGVVDKLHKLYRFDSGPVVPLRSLGLTAVNKLPFLKKFLMNTAASLA